MTRVLAAVEKNSKNVVESMIRVFSIGPDLLTKEQEEILVSKGASLDRFKTIDNIVFRPENKPDLILIDKNQSKAPSFRSFTDRFKDIPKIVFSRRRRFGISCLVKKPLNVSNSNPLVERTGFSYKKGIERKRNPD